MKTTAELELAAAEAERLRIDPAFQQAVTDLRKQAVERLVAADASNTDEIRTIQAEIKAIDGLCGQIAGAILRAPRKPMAVA